MAQEFPYITHIDQVLPHLADRPEFIHGQNSPHFDLVDYTIMDSKTFQADDPFTAAIRRECRGLIFHKDGTVARRAFHKFFNVGETEETALDILDLAEPHMVLEKLDGSMVAPFISQLDKDIYWASMRGSDVYHLKLQAEYAGTAYDALVREASNADLTAIFEYCSSDNRIVVDYGAPVMTLLAMRHKHTGVYLDRSELEDIAGGYGVPVVNHFQHGAGDIEGLLEEVRYLKGMEGSVIWFDSGKLAKLKGEWYLQLHKILTYFDFEKDVARLVLTGNQDDLIGILNGERKQRLLVYQDALMDGIKQLAETCSQVADKIVKEGQTRKDFATCKVQIEPVVKTAIFKNWDVLNDVDFLNDVIEFALKQTGSHSRWTQFKTDSGLTLEWESKGV